MLESLHLIAEATNSICLLVSWCVFNCLDNLADLFVLFLQVLEAVLLPSVLSNEVFHLSCLLNLVQLLLHCLGILVNEAEELLSDAHYHVTNIILPASQVVLGEIVIQNCLLCKLTHFVEFIERGNIALIDVLNVLFVDEAREALKALLFRRVKVQPASVNLTTLAKTLRSSHFSCLHHCLYDI